MPGQGMDIDRLILAILQREDAEAAITALNQAGLAVTAIGSLGGFMRTSNVTLLVGLQAGDVDKAVGLLKSSSHRRTARASQEADVGGWLLTIPVARHVRLCPGEQDRVPRRQATEPGAIQVILAIVSQQQSDRLLKTLTDWSYRGTLVSTTGGFMRHANATVLIGARSDRVDSIVEQVHQVCQEGSSDSAATVFVLDAGQYERM